MARIAEWQGEMHEAVDAAALHARALVYERHKTLRGPLTPPAAPLSAPPLHCC